MEGKGWGWGWGWGWGLPHLFASRTIDIFPWSAALGIVGDP